MLLDGEQRRTEKNGKNISQKSLTVHQHTRNCGNSLVTRFTFSLWLSKHFLHGERRKQFFTPIFVHVLLFFLQARSSQRLKWRAWKMKLTIMFAVNLKYLFFFFYNGPILLPKIEWLENLMLTWMLKEISYHNNNRRILKIDTSEVFEFPLGKKFEKLLACLLFQDFSTSKNLQEFSEKEFDKGVRQKRPLLMIAWLTFEPLMLSIIHLNFTPFSCTFLLSSKGSPSVLQSRLKLTHSKRENGNFFHYELFGMAEWQTTFVDLYVTEPETHKSQARCENATRFCSKENISLLTRETLNSRMETDFMSNLL